MGKSSLLNALAGAELAIVTPIPGTTRDKVSQTIQIEGVPLHVMDTAGLRHSEDLVEQIGIEPTRVYTVEDARDFLSAKDIDLDAFAAQVDGKFMRRNAEPKLMLAGGIEAS